MLKIMIFYALKTFFKFSSFFLKLFGQKPAVADDFYILPAAQLIGFLSEKFNAGLTSSKDPKLARRNMEISSKIAMPKIKDIYWFEFVINLNSHSLKARFYRPFQNSTLDKAILFFHGGGFVLGSIKSHDATAALIAKTTQLPVISVDYRLAPEHQFPAAALDAIDCFDWLVKHASKFDINPQKIIVAGDSAGGNLAAVVAQQRKDSDVKPLAQVLLYPVLDFHFNSQSHKLFSNGFFLTRADLQYFMEQYLSDPQQAKDPMASPLLNKEFSNLAPALIITAGFDPLRDDGYKYFELLQKNNVLVIYKCYYDLIHGFMNMAIIPNGIDIIKEVCHTIKLFTDNIVDQRP
jgi:acetyl esterase